MKAILLALGLMSSTACLAPGSNLKPVKVLGGDKIEGGATYVCRPSKDLQDFTCVQVDMAMVPEPSSKGGI